MQSSTEFIEHIKTKTVPHGYHLISFDVISLFTNALLDFTIDKREMKELIKLCTKVVHFNFNGTTYVQKDRVAMGSLLATVLAGIFMAELERAIILKLSHNLEFWVMLC